MYQLSFQRFNEDVIVHGHQNVLSWQALVQLQEASICNLEAIRLVYYNLNISFIKNNNLIIYLAH